MRVKGVSENVCGNPLPGWTERSVGEEPITGTQPRGDLVRADPPVGLPMHSGLPHDPLPKFVCLSAALYGRLAACGGLAIRPFGPH